MLTSCSRCRTKRDVDRRPPRALRLSAPTRSSCSHALNLAAASSQQPRSTTRTSLRKLHLPTLAFCSSGTSHALQRQPKFIFFCHVSLTSLQCSNRCGAKQAHMHPVLRNKRTMYDTRSHGHAKAEGRTALSPDLLHVRPKTLASYTLMLSFHAGRTRMCQCLAAPVAVRAEQLGDQAALPLRHHLRHHEPQEACGKESVRTPMFATARYPGNVNSVQACWSRGRGEGVLTWRWR